ncbi:unnamed protein product [Parascedosporium putredinis]|uniref:FAD dependent oxidoreductase domain-containing protein n=1 Tax=Parascedosporium putredinis TaxID=1442378 RepID=A0A9P1H513_9PEZI|nr:unnamed protein product [Parascedosporium putredinis]CAI7997327.1 unnamed protein product [Parascedosporium putredinis]
MTHGIAFLGTPHHGAALARWAELLSQSIGIIKQTNTKIVQVLRQDSEVLARIQDEFHNMIMARSKGEHPIEISCFFEELPLPGVGQVVPQHSAILPGYIPIGIRANHMDMVRFSSTDDAGFKAVCSELRRWIKGVHRVVENVNGAVEDRNQDEAPFLVPYPQNQDFVGRAEILEQLRSQLGHGQERPSGKWHLRAALHGLGGIGYKRSYSHFVLRKTRPEVSVFWVHASNGERFRQSYASIAKDCEIPGHDDPSTDMLSLVKDWLNNKDRGQWLMVIDNADDAQLLLARRMAALAKTFCNQGRWEEAEKLEVQVMEMRKAKLGDDHPDTLTSMANLALTFWDQGRLEEAKKLGVQVIEMRKVKLGDDHPDTLTSMANLALTLWDQGRLEEAEKLEVQVMEMRKAKLGDDHPDTLTSMANLASTFKGQGRLEEAEKLGVQVMEMRKVKLGDDHPDTLTSMANLASTFQGQGRLEEAEKLGVQVMEMRKVKLGDDHPVTLTSMANLASTFKGQGRLEEAEKLGVQVMEMRKVKLGMITLIPLQGQGRLEEAEKLEVQVMEMRKVKLGDDHPNTLTSMANLTSTFQGQGRLEEAEKLETFTGNFKMAAKGTSYLIIGSGVFGVSTAYHLIQKYPTASVTLVDRDAYDAESRVAASWDWNKVVRADYDDKVYCQLALEAQDVFQSDPLWKPYFHQTGVYWICRSSYAQDVINHHKGFGRHNDIEALPVAQARKMFDGLFDNADYTGAKEVLLNKSSGWGAAGDSSHVIVSAGAFTPTLLEMSAEASGNEGLSAGSRILAAGITTGMAQLTAEQYQKFKNMPVGFQGYTPNEGKPFIGSLPPTKDGELKWWGSKIFTNTREVLPGRYLSSPPAASDYNQWKVPGPLKQDIVESRNLWYGPASADWRMTKHRICWDAFTTTSDFIISPHSAARGLYIATCGSFHGYKFFPVLGKYITQMMEGELSPELADKWAWDRKRPDPSQNVEYPNTEANHLLERMTKL